MCKRLGIVALVLVAAFVVHEIPAMRRYVKMERM
jgi:hypothetical protein